MKVALRGWQMTWDTFWEVRLTDAPRSSPVPRRSPEKATFMPCSS